MIINLHFDVFNKNRFLYEGPYIMLERNYTYEIGVRHVHIELQGNQISKDNDLWCLSTNLVDRSPANTRQAVSYFTFARGKVNHDIICSPVVFYPLEVHQLENPEFLIQRITKDKTLGIEQAFIQVEIQKCLESARV